jgi:hypothetical protein
MWLDKEGETSGMIRFYTNRIGHDMDRCGFSGKVACFRYLMWFFYTSLGVAMSGLYAAEQGRATRTVEVDATTGSTPRSMDRLRDWEYLERQVHRLMCAWGRFFSRWEDITAMHHTSGRRPSA